LIRSRGRKKNGLDKNIKEKLKVYTIYSNSHQNLFEKYFLSSLKNTDLELVSKKIDENGTGEYLSKDYLENIVSKVDFIIQTILDNIGEVFVFSDVDIIFFKKISNDLMLLLGDKDILFQSDSYNGKLLCTGIFVCRANERTLKLWQMCRENLEKSIALGSCLHDQDWINTLLKENPQLVKFDILPFDRYYSPRESVDLKNIPPIPRSICTYHANWIIGINNKECLLSQAQEIINQ